MLNGLCQVVLNACISTLLSGRLIIVGTHCCDSNLRQVWISSAGFFPVLKDFDAGSDPIHDGHLNVREDKSDAGVATLFGHAGEAYVDSLLSIARHLALLFKLIADDRL